MPNRGDGGDGGDVGDAVGLKLLWYIMPFK